MFTFETLKKAMGVTRPNLLFVHIGDFYEAYDVDAQEIAKRFNLVLTKRSLSSDKSSDERKSVDMTGFPAASLDKYLAEIGKDIVFFEMDNSKTTIYPVSATSNEELLRVMMLFELVEFETAMKENPCYKTAYDFVYASDIFHQWWEYSIDNATDGDVQALIETGCPLNILLELWLDSEACIDNILLGAIQIYHTEREVIESMKYSRLTIKQCDVLDKIASKSGMDCWFYIPAEGRYVYDAEEGKNLSLDIAIGQLVEGMTSYEDYRLTKEEIDTFEDLCNAYNIDIKFLRKEN